MSIPPVELLADTTDEFSHSVEEVAPAIGGRWRAVGRALGHSPGATVAMAWIVLLCLATTFAPLLAPDDPNLQTLTARLKGPSGAHLLGTDELGRDVLSRLLYGGRVSFAVGLSAATLAAIIGMIIAGIGSMAGSWVRALIRRIIDIQLGFPFLVIAISVIAIIGPSLPTIIIVLGIWTWVPIARVALTRMETILTLDYIKAARASGRRTVGIFFSHVLPNIVGPLVVVWTFVIAEAIVAEAALSFLALGLRPPTATWGNMLSEGRGYLDTAWWISTFAGIAIITLLAAINVVGDFFAKMFDPHRKA